MFGLIILIVGITLLLRNLGYLSVELWNIVWPSIWIIVGLKFMFKKKGHGHKNGHGHGHDYWCCGQGDKKEER